MFPFGNDPTEIFEIVIHKSQLQLIRDDLALQPRSEERAALIDMIDDAFTQRDNGDLETHFGFCY